MKVVPSRQRIFFFQLIVYLNLRPVQQKTLNESNTSVVKTIISSKPPKTIKNPMIWPVPTFQKLLGLLTYASEHKLKLRLFIQAYYVDTCYKERTKFEGNVPVSETVMPCSKSKMIEFWMHVSHFRFFDFVYIWTK